MCDKINTNIEDYNEDDLFSLLSLTKETSSKSLIQSQTQQLKEQFLDTEFHMFMNKVSDKLVLSLNKQCGYETNIINYDTQENLKHNMSLINPNNNKYYERNIVEKVLIVDTKYRDHFTAEKSTDFTITLPSIIKNVISIQLSDIEFPNTWYPFDEAKGNTFFHMKKSSQETWTRIDISSQAYYYGNLFSRMNNKIIEKDLNISFSLNLDFNNPAGSPDGTATISIDASGEDINYDFDFFSLDPNEQLYEGGDYGLCSRFLGWNLGFRNIEPMYYSKQSSYLSESTIDLGGPRYIYLVVDDHNKYMNESYIPFSKNMSTIKDTFNIFARISLQGSAFSLYNSNSFSVFSDIRKYNGLVDLSRMTIKLTDEFGSPLNLNNNDFSFTIRINTVQTT